MTLSLEIRDLGIAIDARPLVTGVSLALPVGEALTILGESGSGKSLVSHAVMGTLPAGLATTGEIGLFGEVTRPARRQHLWGRRLALLPQEPWRALDPTMRTLPQVAEGRRGSRAVGARWAGEMLDRLHVGAARDRFPFMLSGGMAQRVACAAASAAGAELLIVDEPTKGLDAALRDQLAAMLAEIVAAGRSLLTITHDVHVARALGGQVAVMLDGMVVEQGPASQVLDAPSHPYTRRLLAADPAVWPDRDQPTPGAPLLVGTDLSRSFGDQRVFAGIQASIGQGERVAIVGPSGSGKTTLGDILLGLARPDTGSVVRASGLAPTALQKLYQDPPAAFPPRVTLRQSLADLTAHRGVPWSAVDRLLDRLRLAPHLLDRLPDQVSGGELQRLALLRILLVEPALIFADEATSRLDPITQQETIDLLVEQTAARGCALLLVTHDAALAHNVCGAAEIRLR